MITRSKTRRRVTYEIMRDGRNRLYVIDAEMGCTVHATDAMLQRMAAALNKKVTDRLAKRPVVC